MAINELFLATNPFTDNRVNAPAADGVDVETIHQKAFERLTALAREARDTRRGLGAMLWGEAGIGKSHLLARLARWAERDKNASLVYLHNLQASPENLPRSLLKAVVSILTWGRLRRLHPTPLYRLVNASLCEALTQDGKKQTSMSQLEASFHRWTERLCAAEPARAALIDRTIHDVCFQLFRSDHWIWEGIDDGVAALAVRWLGGDYLDPDEARQLGLPPGPSPEAPVALADNQQVKQVLVALSRMALSRRQPFILCFDQVDNLDEAQAAALFRFLEALLDSAPNLLIVTAGIQATLLRWRMDKVIQDSAWDRLAQFEVSLQRVSPPEGERIVTARLERVLAPVLGLKEVRRLLAADPLFPLGRTWKDEFLKGKIDLRPRAVLNAAREGWRREQEALSDLGEEVWLAGWGTARSTNGQGESPEPAAAQVETLIDERVERKLAELKARRLAEPHTLPADAAQLAGLVLALLRQCQDADPGFCLTSVDWAAPARSATPRYDLLAHQQPDGDESEERTRLLFVVTYSATSTTAALRRLLREAEPPERAWLVTDERQPLPLAATGREHYGQLRQRGEELFRHVKLSFEEIAGLDALQAVIGLARGGDLEIEPRPGRSRPVSEAEVIASHQRRGRYREAPLLRELVSRRSSAALEHDRSSLSNGSEWSKVSEACS